MQKKQALDAANHRLPNRCVIREMPPHEILDMIARMWEAIGVFVDKTA